MQLFYREEGKGIPLIILHGLWGASENWLTIAHYLSPYFRVILPDLRNHGHSPHSPVHNYDAMTQDVTELIHHLHLPVKPHLIGHSMGGKIGMALLLKKPDMIAKSVILDIAPRNYILSNEHERLFEFIHLTKLNEFPSYRGFRNYLASYFPSEQEQQILLKNIRKTEKGLIWKINAEVLYNNRNTICQWPEDLKHLKYDTPLLFIKGGKSSYIPGIEELKNNFPAALLSTLPDSGHGLHTEQPEKLAEMLLKFLNA